ncbi:unnamed protein product [Ectocarpus sp. 12 AP-2014]
MTTTGGQPPPGVQQSIMAHDEMLPVDRNSNTAERLDAPTSAHPQTPGVMSTGTGQQQSNAVQQFTAVQLSTAVQQSAAIIQQSTAGQQSTPVQQGVNPYGGCGCRSG